jgi:hypothetical protein
MNASDIVKLKQNGTLYKAYYNPTVFQSSVISTLIPFSATEGQDTIYTSCIQTKYNYVCNPTYITYELVNDVNNGKYVCGGKTPSELKWENNIPTTLYNYFYSSGSTTVSTTSTTILTGPGPFVQPMTIFNQGTNFANKCDICNNFGAGINACCHNCSN